MPGLDLHQHLWPESFTALLARRTAPPSLERDGRGWRVMLSGEPDAPFEPGAHDAGARVRGLTERGLDRALLAMSSPLGVEALPRPEAEPLLAAWHDGVLGIDERLGAWGAVPLDDPDPADVDALLDRGVAGISLPAGALGSPEALDRLGAVLEALERRDAPLFVHPGPDAAGRTAPPGGPAPWFAALTTYLAQLHAAWLTFAAWGRPAHPRLRVLFAALAGGAPLHAERIAARGGPALALHDPLVFHDTSSYGARAVDAAIRAVGVDVLVHGSDAPVVAGAPDPGHNLGPGVTAALTITNPRRLLGVPVGAPNGNVLQAAA